MCIRDRLSAALRQPDQWCEVMILHINTKYCRASNGPTGARLNVNIGTKTAQELAQSARLAFSFSVLAATPDYFEVFRPGRSGLVQ